jgi:hydroxyquinol 1,2-dioxygenase
MRVYTQYALLGGAVQSRTRVWVYLENAGSNNTRQPPQIRHRRRPIHGAMLDVWQASPEGLYESQDPNQPDMNLRGKFKTDANGAYWFKTVKPAAYPIPDDGPVGDMLRAIGRHPMRPAHIHYMISAPGYETLITHVFPEGDEYLDSDAVFSVKDSLVADFVKNESADSAAKYGVKAPFYEVSFDFGLKPIAETA